MKINLTIRLEILGWFIYWILLTSINVIYFKSNIFPIYTKIIWTILFTLIGILIFFSITKIYSLLLKRKTSYVLIILFIIVLSFIGAYAWGIFEPIISWLINFNIKKLKIAWDINTRGTFSLTFIFAFFSVLFFLGRSIEKSSLQKKNSIRHLENSDTNNIVSVYFKNDIILLPIENIKKISISGNYSEIIDKNNKKYTLRRTLKTWETQLPFQFIRVHRTTIINKLYIEKIEPLFNYTYNIVLKDSSEPIPVSKRYSLIIKKDLKLDKYRI